MAALVLVHLVSPPHLLFWPLLSFCSEIYANVLNITHILYFNWYVITEFDDFYLAIYCFLRTFMYILSYCLYYVNDITKLIVIK